MDASLAAANHIVYAKPHDFESTSRAGTFSSSNAWKLMIRNKAGNDFGDRAKTYIKQVRHEITLGREINSETNNRPCSWGRFVERRVFEMLNFSYKLVSSDRLFHPTISNWSGSPDLIKPNTVSDVKCPFSLEVFCDKIEALNAGIDVYKKAFPEDYWQHVSNTVLLEANGIPVTHAEAIIYVPYKKELAEIREEVQNYEGDQNEVAWINWADDNRLPYLLDGGHYKNLNVISFEINQEDKQALTERVIQAGQLLIKR